MGSQDIIELDAAEDNVNELPKSASEPIGVVNLELDEGANGREKDLGAMKLEASSGPELQERVNLLESVTVFEQVLNEVEPVGDKEENGFQGMPVNGSGSPENNGSDASYISGRKRARTAYADDQPSVRVIYRSLTRASINKLEELMQEWSKLHACHCSSNSKSPEKALKSGEETFFPALHIIGSKEKKSVPFWVDNQGVSELSHTTSNEIDSAPLYDRGYITGLTSFDHSSRLQGKLEEVEASRCFNCGSYNHSLKECLKPRDNVAVNNARRLHNLKRSVTSGPRYPTRYYQNSPGGKFEGLKPGSLSAETRQSLGIGEHDPPPWLNRMREIGYPPGYLDVEDKPSGITIIGDDKPLEEREDREIQEKAEPEISGEMFLEFSKVEPAPAEKKMTVEFPGLNATIPPTADEQLWSSMSSADARSHRSRSNGRAGIDRGGQRDDRRSRGYMDESPPGTSLFESGYAGRYHDSVGSREPPSVRGYDNASRRPDLGRYFSDRSTPGFDSPYYRNNNFDAYSYSSNNRWSSQSLDRWNPNDQYHSSSDRNGHHDYNWFESHGFTSYEYNLRGGEPCIYMSGFGYLM